MVAPQELFERFYNNERAQSYYSERNRLRDEVRTEQLLPLLEEFLNGDVGLNEYKPRNDGINKESPYWGFDGFNGQMHFNQIYNASPEVSDLAAHLREVMVIPESDSEARNKIDEHAELAHRLRENSVDAEPRFKPAMFFLSYFWHIQEPTEYPIFYTTTEQYLESQDLFIQENDYGDDYIEFVEVVDNLKGIGSEFAGESIEYRDVANAIYWHEKLREEWEEETIEEPNEHSVEFPEIVSDAFLPPVIGDLSEVSQRSETAEHRYEESDTSLAVIFEDKLHHAFRTIGYDVEELGQGSGREPDGVAEAVRNDYAVIYDAKVRTNGYDINTDDRAIREYIQTHGRRLRDQGMQNIYFAIVSSTFSDPDQSTLREIRTHTDVDNIVLLSADLVEDMAKMRLREPYLNLDDFEEVFSSRTGIFRREELNNIIPEWREITLEDLL